MLTLAEIRTSKIILANLTLYLSIKKSVYKILLKKFLISNYKENISVNFCN